VCEPVTPKTFPIVIGEIPPTTVYLQNSFESEHFDEEDLLALFNNEQTASGCKLTFDLCGSTACDPVDASNGEGVEVDYEMIGSFLTIYAHRISGSVFTPTASRAQLCSPSTSEPRQSTESSTTSK